MNIEMDTTVKAVVVIQAATLFVLATLGFIVAKARRVTLKVEQGAVPADAYCSHCGVAINHDPDSEIAVKGKSFLVYTCKSCFGETLLTIPPSSE